MTVNDKDSKKSRKGLARKKSALVAPSLIPQPADLIMETSFQSAETAAEESKIGQDPQLQHGSDALVISERHGGQAIELSAETDSSGSTASDNEDSVKLPQVTSLDDLITAAYRESGKKLTLPKSTYDLIDRNSKYPINNDPCIELIVKLSQSDLLLAVPLRLLVHVDEAAAPKGVKRRVLECVTFALRQHPVFKTKLLQDALSRTEPLSENVFAELHGAVRRQSQLQNSKRSRISVRNDEIRLWLHAATTLVYLTALRGAWTYEQLVTALYTHVWSAYPEPSSESSSRSAAVDIRNTNSIRQMINVYDTQLRCAAEDLSRVDGKVELMSARIMDLESQIMRSELALAERDRAIVDLNEKSAELLKNVSDMSTQREVDRSHYLADFEALRTRTSRMLNEHLRLLADGLHALRNGRHQVADEYLERIHDSLSKEHDRLRLEGDQER